MWNTFDTHRPETTFSTDETAYDTNNMARKKMERESNSVNLERDKRVLGSFQGISLNRKLMFDDQLT